jgi:classical protein kinase C beta type
LQELPYGASVDWWSLGVLVYEMLVGDSPFSGEDEDELFEQILRKNVTFPDFVQQPARQLITAFLNRDPTKRLGVGKSGEEDIRKHAYFATVNWEKLEKRQIEPPFLPTVKGKKEANNFDNEFTEAKVDMTPPNASTIAQIDPAAFRGFSFVNNNWGLGPQQQVVEPPSSGLEGHSWYRPDLARDEAVKALSGQPAGTFYVRESFTQPGCYAITMQRNGSPWHGLITPSTTPDGRTLYKLFVKQKFESLPELVDYYTTHAVATDTDGKKMCLVKP